MTRAGIEYDIDQHFVTALAFIDRANKYQALPNLLSVLLKAVGAGGGGGGGGGGG